MRLGGMESPGRIRAGKVAVIITLMQKLLATNTRSGAIAALVIWACVCLVALPALVSIDWVYDKREKYRG